MSKSYGNAIGLTDSAKDMFGKTMRVSDEAMRDWYTLLTRVPIAEIERALAGTSARRRPASREEIASFFHGREAGGPRARRSTGSSATRRCPTTCRSSRGRRRRAGVGLPLANLLKDLGLEKSTSDARRSIEQGGVKLDGEIVRDPKTLVRSPAGELLIQVGKRRYARVQGARNAP
jgi:tyrosyl-tRNA synthetase